MTAYDFVHLALSAVGGRIEGKTKLQKTIYFLGKFTSNLDMLGYRPHYYGPYSSDVAAASDRLRSLGFVDCNIASGGRLDSRGFEVARCDFTLNVEGVRLAKSKAERYPRLWEDLQKAAARLEGAGNPDYKLLSVAAKTDFMLENREKATTGELSKLARTFGWTVSDDEVLEAGKFLEKVDLVKLGE